MLRLMVNAHPRLAVPFETNFIPKYFNNLASYGDLSIPANVERLLADIASEPFVVKGNLIADRQAILKQSPRSLADLVSAIFQTYAEREGKQRWGDKTPSFVTELDILWQLFPNCKIVHIIRDGRDVACSLRKLSWGSRNLPRLARNWAWQVTMGRKMGRIIGPDHYLEIYYEALVANPEGTLKEVCRFLGEEFDNSLLDYHRKGNKAMPSASLDYHRNSVSAPDTDKIQMWRKQMSAADQVLFEQEAGKVLEEFGYEAVGQPPNLGSRLAYLKYSLFSRW
jgi:hypothetical protein